MTLLTVTPQENWDIFLELTYEYLIESWPHKFQQKSFSEFRTDYEKELLQRIEEGGRYLFLYKSGDDIIGLANLYMDKNDKEVLHIAEFYICPKMRKQNFGKLFLNSLIKFSLQNRIKHLYAEVDSGLAGANQFWDSVGKLKNSAHERNIYNISVKQTI